jgi:Na+/phosphate symporter
LRKAESRNIKGVISESSQNIAHAIGRVNKIYSSSIEGLVKHDLNLLKKSTKGIRKLDKEVESLRENIFYFIKNLDEGSDGTTDFYLQVLRHLQDITQSLEHISHAAFKHVNNNHRKLRFSQLKDLKETDKFVTSFFEGVEKLFEKGRFSDLNTTLVKQEALLKQVDDKIRLQIKRTRETENSPKNTALYFNLLQETRDLLEATFRLLELYDLHANKVKVDF